jgi:hypothetical protein
MKDKLKDIDNDWEEISIIVSKFNELFQESIGKNFTIVYLIFDDNSNKGGVAHTCDPHLAENIIHDAFDNYDASNVRSFLDSEK